MRMERFTYAQAESALYEAMRWLGVDGKILAERESRARIDERLTCHNICYVKECLMPDGKYRTKKYAKEHRGEAIAAYHNSQTSSQSRAMMSGQRESNAVGVVATLPRDNPWLVRAELTDEEYEYLRDKMIEKLHDSTSHTRDEALEKSIREKLTRIRPTEEEMEQINAFLLAVMDAWLEVCRIRQEDVLFYALHWDESFPHVHAMALPTVERTYEEDIYSKRAKKDGTHTLLHKAGETAITYSVSRFYADAYYGEDEKRHYPFMESYHQKVIECLQNNPELSDEIRQTAGKLLNGATKQRAFIPRDYNREQRDESVFLAEANRILQAKNAEKDKQIEEAEAILLAFFQMNVSPCKCAQFPRPHESPKQERNQRTALDRPKYSVAIWLHAMLMDGFHLRIVPHRPQWYRLASAILVIVLDHSGPLLSCAPFLFHGLLHRQHRIEFCCTNILLIEVHIKKLVYLVLRRMGKSIA